MLEPEPVSEKWASSFSVSVSVVPFSVIASGRRKFTLSRLGTLGEEGVASSSRASNTFVVLFLKISTSHVPPSSTHSPLHDAQKLTTV